MYALDFLVVTAILHDYTNISLQLLDGLEATLQNLPNFGRIAKIV